MQTAVTDVKQTNILVSDSVSQAKLVDMNTE